MPDGECIGYHLVVKINRNSNSLKWSKHISNRNIFNGCRLNSYQHNLHEVKVKKIIILVTKSRSSCRSQILAQNHFLLSSYRGLKFNLCSIAVYWSVPWFIMLSCNISSLPKTSIYVPKCFMRFSKHITTSGHMKNVYNMLTFLINWVTCIKLDC